MVNWSEFDRGVFLVNVLGIVYNPITKKILIGRRENDPYIKGLSWTFPGGRPAYGGELEQCLQEQIKIKTNLDTHVEKIVFAKTYPEKREFLSIYYLCAVTSGTEQALQAPYNPAAAGYTGQAPYNNRLYTGQAVLDWIGPQLSAQKGKRKEVVILTRNTTLTQNIKRGILVFDIYD